jgi:hypothetical protein
MYRVRHAVRAAYGKLVPRGTLARGALLACLALLAALRVTYYELYLPPRAVSHVVASEAAGAAAARASNIPTFPRLVHQMWKSGAPLPRQTVGWIDGCKALNPDFVFHMYDDEDLLRFTETHYPEYLPMFKSLHGVCEFVRRFGCKKQRRTRGRFGRERSRSRLSRQTWRTWRGCCRSTTTGASTSTSTSTATARSSASTPLRPTWPRSSVPPRGSPTRAAATS